MHDIRVTGPRHLGMLGAEVIKVESPIGDPFRSHKGFPDFNQVRPTRVCMRDFAFLSPPTESAIKPLLMRLFDICRANAALF